MNKTRAALAATLVAALALPALGQVQYGGYLSFEYVKGQAESDYRRGSLENLLAGFLVAGRVQEKFGFAIEAQARGVSSFDLLQAWAGFLPSKAITVRAGLFLVPFGAWNRSSRPHETILIRTPLNLELLYPAYWRELGLLVEGEVGVLSYAAYIGNGLAETDEPGSGQQFSDNNTDKAKGGRIGLVAGGGIRAGVSYYMGKYDDLNMRDLVLEGADFAWVTDQWEFHGEYTKALLENPQPFERGESEGFVLWTSMSFRSFQPFGSFQKVKYSDGYHGGGIELDRSRWCAGVRWLLGQTMFIKIEYDWNKEKEAVELKNNQIQAQVGLSF
jgi:hypothetical protein